LGFQCAGPGFRDSPAEPTGLFQGLLEFQRLSRKTYQLLSSVASILRLNPYSAGRSSVLEASKMEMQRELGVPFRDLMILDPNLPTACGATPGPTPIVYAHFDKVRQTV
jgi:hypothetical protein